MIVLSSSVSVKLIINILQKLKYNILGLYDDNINKHGNLICGSKIIGVISDIKDNNDTNLVCAIGSNTRRKEIINKCKTELNP